MASQLRQAKEDHQKELQSLNSKHASEMENERSKNRSDQSQREIEDLQRRMKDKDRELREKEEKVQQIMNEKLQLSMKCDKFETKATSSENALADATRRYEIKNCIDHS